MNADQRKILSDRHVRRVKLFERRFAPEIYRAIREPMLSVADTLLSEGVHAARNKANTFIIIDGVSNAIKDIYVTVGIWSGKKTLAQIRNKKADHPIGFGFNPIWREAILNYFKLFLLTRAVLPISETTRKIILDILIQGEINGLSADAMARMLRETELPASRALTIVRTEIAKASFFGHELGRHDTPFLTTERWIAAKDAKTRHSHRLVDGDIVPSGTPFKVGVYKKDLLIGYEMMLGPGDPDASAGNVINCRCTRVTRLLRDENNRFVRRTKMTDILSIKIFA